MCAHVLRSAGFAIRFALPCCSFECFRATLRSSTIYFALLNYSLGSTVLHSAGSSICCVSLCLWAMVAIRQQQHRSLSTQYQQGRHSADPYRTLGSAPLDLQSAALRSCIHLSTTALRSAGSAICCALLFGSTALRSAGSDVICSIPLICDSSTPLRSVPLLAMDKGSEW